MTLTEVIQKNAQRHLYMKSAITSGTTQYIYAIFNSIKTQMPGQEFQYASGKELISRKFLS